MSLLRADAISIPLRDNSVDLIITSPPYFALRSYTDGGEHYDGVIQIARFWVDHRTSTDDETYNSE